MVFITNSSPKSRQPFLLMNQNIQILYSKENLLISQHENSHTRSCLGETPRPRPCTPSKASISFVSGSVKTSRSDRLGLTTPLTIARCPGLARLPILQPCQSGRDAVPVTPTAMNFFLFLAFLFLWFSFSFFFSAEKSEGR